MNATHSTPSPDSHVGSRSRLACRIVRLWRALFGGRSSRHVASCADCQEYFRAADVLEHALRRDAAQAVRAAPVASEGFERQILMAVRNSRPGVTSARSQPWRNPWALGGIGAAVLACFAVFLNRDPLFNERGDSPGVIAATDAAVIVDAVESLSNQLVDSVIPSAGQLVARNPLQQEIGSVYSDVRSALDFLALNFLPSPATQAEPRNRTI